MAGRCFLIVLDSLGVGALPDAEQYGDAGANTLLSVLKAENPRLSTLKSLGLMSLPGIVEAFGPQHPPFGAYGVLRAISPGKDTTTGHWELAGLTLQKPFPTYPQGFPDDLMRRFEARIGRKTLGNCTASGTEIIKRLGEEHVRTGYPIVYTSADSVFQIAAHEEVIPTEKLYEICKEARAMLTGKHGVGRVIARPFTGVPGKFARTSHRRDFSLPPHSPTMLDDIKAAGLSVMAVGKIDDIFAGRGITKSFHVSGNDDCQRATLELAADHSWKGLAFTNLVDFDSLYGHRRDIAGYARALKSTDTWLATLLRELAAGDLVLITADHGCDPAHGGTDHTREAVPLLAYSSAVCKGPLPGGRMADVSATVLSYLGLPVFAGTTPLPIFREV